MISNCVLYSHDSALKVGTETCHAIRHVVLSDCVFRDCSRGVGIWARDGAIIEDIHVHHVSGNTKRYADCPQRKFAPRWWGKGEPIFISATPRRPGEHPGYIRNISFDHIYMTVESALFLAGEEESRIKNVSIEKMHLIMKSKAHRMRMCLMNNRQSEEFIRIQYLWFMPDVWIILRLMER